MIELNNLTQSFHEHPLKVSIATHKINKYITSMHRYMKDVVLSEDEEELQLALENVNSDVKSVYKEFDILFFAYLGDKKDIETVYELFGDWSDLREKVVELIRKNRKSEAINMNKTVAFQHVNRLHESLSVISEYAHHKAELFVQNSNETKDLSIVMTIVTVLITLTLMLSVMIILIKSIRRAEDFRHKQEQHLIEHSRLAQMGEMISMIAHQWRQPLAAIAAVAIELKMNIELEIYDFKNTKERDKCISSLTEGLESIENFTQGLSTTIDDFRNFYKPDKKPVVSNINEPILKAMNIVKSSLIGKNITVIEALNSVKKQELIDSELMQVFLNIFQNSQDNFQEKKTQKATIWITTEDTESGVIATISDNGGGMDRNSIKSIFDPYFSTKHIKNGTGLGMYMSKTIAETHHKGSISAENTDSGLSINIKLYD